MNFDSYIENARTGERTQLQPEILAALAGDGRRAPRAKRPQTEELRERIEPLLSIVEAAEKFGLPRRRLDDAINGGELAFYQIGAKARKLKGSDISAWLERKKKRISCFGGEDE